MTQELANGLQYTDPRIIAAIISAIVSFVVLLLSKFIFEPKKEKKVIKKEQLQKLYAPLYAIIITMSNEGKRGSNRNNIEEYILLKSIDNSTFNQNNLDKIFIGNMGYASFKLINLYLDIKKEENEFRKIQKEHEFTILAIKEFHQLSKKLKLSFDKEELKTGIPANYSELRRNKK